MASTPTMSRKHALIYLLSVVLSIIITSIFVRANCTSYLLTFDVWCSQTEHTGRFHWCGTVHPYSESHLHTCTCPHTHFSTHADTFQVMLICHYICIACLSSKGTRLSHIFGQHYNFPNLSEFFFIQKTPWFVPILYHIKAVVHVCVIQKKFYHIGRLSYALL